MPRAASICRGFLRVRLRADKGLAQAKIFARSIPFSPKVRKIKCVAGRDMDHRRAKVLHEHELAFRGARPAGITMQPNFSAP